MSDNGTRIYDSLDIATNSGYRIEVYEKPISPGTEAFINAMTEETRKQLETPIDVKSEADYNRVVSMIKANKANMKKRDALYDDCNGLVNIVHNALSDSFSPLVKGQKELEAMLKEKATKYQVETERAAAIETAEKKKKAEEEARIVRDAAAKKAEEERRRAEALAKQRREEIEQKQAAIRKKAEEEEKRRQLEQKRKEEEERKKAATDAEEAAKIDEEIERISQEEVSVEEVVKKLEDEVVSRADQVKILGRQEYEAKTKAHNLDIHSKTYTKQPEMNLIRPVGKVAGVCHPRRIRHKLIDLTLKKVPDYWIKKTLDDEKVKDAIKVQGLDLKIPGVEIYEEVGMSSTSS